MNLEQQTDAILEELSEHVHEPRVAQLLLQLILTIQKERSNRNNPNVPTHVPIPIKVVEDYTSNVKPVIMKKSIPSPFPKPIPQKVEVEDMYGSGFTSDSTSDY